VSAGASAVAAARWGGRTIDVLLERPRTVLGVLVAAQIAATIALGLTVEHNDWVWFQGGDQIVNTTTGWLAGQRILPPTEISYVWPLVQTPITWITGPTFLQAMPPIVVLQVLVLGPIALGCVYGVASHIGGRLLGYWAALLWVVAPFAVIPLFVDRYHEKWTEQFVPQALGLTAMPDFPSMVLVLVAALLVVRTLTDPRWTDALLAGLVAGAAGGLKPPNYLFVAGAVLAYLVARQWRAGALFLVALAPSLLVVAFWKDRGLGYIPALSLEEVRLASGVDLPGRGQFDRYVELDWDHWLQQMDQLREFFWSARLAQWAPLAGLVAVVRVHRTPVAALLAGWLGAFILVKGFSDRADIQANTFWRLLMPAWPAYLLLFASIPLLVPRLAARLGRRLETPAHSRIAPRWVVVAVVVTLVVPALATAASSQLQPPSPPALVQDLGSSTILTPIDPGISVEAAPEGSGNALRWSSDASWRAKVFYRVYRSDGTGADTLCVTAANVAWNCYLKGQPIATTRDLAFVDPSPPPRATYRVGVGTNWADDPEQGDVFAVSPAVEVNR
jgi:hypothetical protein